MKKSHKYGLFGLLIGLGSLSYLFATDNVVLSDEVPSTSHDIEEKDGIVYEVKSGEPFNGKIVQDGDKDQGFLLLIYGHPYSNKVMEYVDGMLDDVTHYDEGNNMVLCEDYKEGELVFQWSCLGC